jgi:ubiquinone/menaquinone biosynthesis C-methylase UbiE
MRPVRLGEFLIGVEGLAVLRHVVTGDDAMVRARLAEIARFSTGLDEPPLGLAIDVPELDVVPGYARWAATYDDMPNPLISVEERVVEDMIARIPVGRALDAACGTGRHTARLAARGHRVVGIDASPEMLARAQARVPAAELEVGTLEALPLADASVDLAVCALALTHVPDLGPALRELARVVRPGGRLVVSDFHPFLGLIGGLAFFQDAAGESACVRSYVHPHASYLRAFAAAGLLVRDCQEPVHAPEDARKIAFSAFIPEGMEAAYVGLPAALVWELARP